MNLIKDENRALCYRNNYYYTHMAHGNRLTDMEFDEISLVTRPANQLSKVVLYKSGDMDMPETENELFFEEDTEMEKGGYKKGHKNHDDAESEENRIVDEDEAILRLKESKKSMKKDAEVDSMLEYIEALESANESLMAKLDEAEDSYDDDDNSDLLKSADPAIVELFKAAEDRAVIAEEIAKAERENRLQREFIEKAAAYDSLPVEASAFGVVLKDAAESMDADSYDALTTVLSAANEAISQGGLMNEIGITKSFDAESGMGRIEQVASVLQAENADLTREAAIAKAVTDDPSLYDTYNEERR